ncbi:MAG: FMN-binding protein [Phycisphaerae bacterium]|nr:FMN-binding protein [Phycisphaerae bacterium]
MVKIKYFLAQSWLLITASFFFGLLLAITNAAWQPRIKANEEKKFSDSASVLIPQADKFTLDKKVTIKSSKGKPVETEVYKALNEDKTVGYVFKAVGAGFADKIILVVAVDEKLEEMAGFSVLFSNETPGFGDKIKDAYYNDQFKGIPADKLELVKTGDPKIMDDKIVAITGATVSSTAVVNIINNTLLQIKEKMNGEK